MSDKTTINSANRADNEIPELAEKPAESIEDKTTAKEYLADPLANSSLRNSDPNTPASTSNTSSQQSTPRELPADEWSIDKTDSEQSTSVSNSNTVSQQNTPRELPADEWSMDQTDSTSSSNNDLESIHDD